MSACAAACQYYNAVSKLVGSLKCSINRLIAVGYNTGFFLMLDVLKHFRAYFIYVFFARVELGYYYEISVFFRYFTGFFAAVKGFFPYTAEEEAHFSVRIISVHIVKQSLIAHLVVGVVNDYIHGFFRNCVKLHSARYLYSFQPFLYII